MNCYPIIRRLTRPLRRHIRRHAAFHLAGAVIAGCVGGPVALMVLLPPNIVEGAAPIVNIPEPSAALLLGLGAVNLAVLRRFRGKKL